MPLQVPPGQFSEQGPLASVVLSSMMPLQLSSLPLHVSGFVGNTGHTYSQPFAGLPSTSARPEVHVFTTQSPPTQAATAPGSAQTMPQPPQLFTSVVVLKPSS